jgi:hypothetical protein
MAIGRGFFGKRWWKSNSDIAHAGFVVIPAGEIDPAEAASVQT